MGDGRLGFGAYAGCGRELVERTRPTLVLAHETPSAAEAARAANPNAYVLLRSDDGRDQEQPSGGDPDGHARWWVENKVKPKLARAKAGTYDCVVAYNENIPGGDETAHAFRGALEYETCKIIQDELHLHYAAIACSVGNINAQYLHYYAAVIRAARWVNYHGYLKPLRRVAAEETEPYWLWRPLDLWLPELRKLGIPLRLLLGECGTYSDPQSTGISRGEMLRQCIEIDRLVAAKCETLGVEYGGAIPFGFGTLGTMDVWDLTGNEGLVDWAGQQAPARGVWVVPAPPVPTPNTGGKTMSEQEFLRWSADVFKRANVPWNPGSGFAQHWMATVRGGRYLGRPEGPEHPTESGRYILQEFSSAVLCYDTVTGQVSEGLPPFA